MKRENGASMYSSSKEPTHEEWVIESNRLLEDLQGHLDFYRQQITKCQEQGNDFMLRYYCSHMKAGNAKLEMMMLYPQ